MAESLVVVEPSELFTQHAVCNYFAVHGTPRRCLLSTTSNNELLPVPHADCTSSVEYLGGTVQLDVEQHPQPVAGDRWTDYPRVVRLSSAGLSVAQLVDFVGACRLFYRNQTLTGPVSGLSDSVMQYSWDSYSWARAGSQLKRSLDTVHLPGKTADELLGSLRAFVDPAIAERYRRLNVPRLKTVMLAGVPGAGKSSTIYALASELNYSLAVLEFTPDFTDKQLQAAVRKVPRHSFLVIEDIDCLFQHRKQQTGVSFSGLLNAIDGVFKPDGLIVFLTTNLLDDLDYAIKRRADHVVEYGFCARQQAQQMHARFFPDQADRFGQFWQAAGRKKFTPCVLQKFFAKHLSCTDICEHLEDFEYLVGLFRPDGGKGVPSMYL